MSCALDRKGNAITGYGDMNLALCAIDIGFGTGKFARLHVTHLIPSSRLTLDYFIRHAEGDGASLVMFRAIWGLPIEPPKDSLIARIKGRIYRLLSNRPAESFKIYDAYVRGSKAGWKLVQEHLTARRPNSK
jgi:hypothetical protein